MNIKDFITNILFKDGKKITARLNKKWFEHNNHISYYNEIMKLTSFIDFDITFSNRIKYILDDMIYKDHYCKCGAVLRFTKFQNDYVCSKQCEYFFANINEKRIKTNIKKYGTTHPTKCDSVKNKIIQTNNLLYNGNSPMCSQKVKNKAKETNYKNFGKSSNADENVIAKKKKSKLEKYGNENYNNRTKAKKTTLTKYNVDNISQLESVKIKKENTFLKNYGVTNYGKVESVKQKRIIQYLEKIFYFYKNNNDFEYELLFSVNEYIGSKEKEYTFRCKKCNTVFNQKMKNGLSSCRCYNCYPIGINHEQNEILEYIKSLIINDIIQNDRKILDGKELDIYIPFYNLAIEYDGIMFHSFGKNKSSKFNNYLEENILKYNHLYKTEKCAENNIKLLHIFSNEWNDAIKKDIWKSIISSNLSLNNRIFARKCEIRLVKSEDSNNFLENNHLQGKVNSSINLGLYYQNSLVSLLTIGKSRFNKNYEYEILRFCNKKYTNVIGGFSKLLKYFKTNYKFKSLITYADKRYSNGNLYRTAKFTELNDSLPNYFYFNSDNKLENRIKFQKHKLKELLVEFDENLSETENMYNNNYRKIYDCGNKVFEFILEST